MANVGLRYQMHCMVQGGDVLHGALMGLTCFAAGESVEGLGKRWGTSLGVKALQTSIVAVAGGTVAELGGGNFANGAMTAAFAFLFNDMMSHHSHAEDSNFGKLIANKALEYLGSERWAKSRPPRGFSKCNIFVQDILTELGLFKGDYLPAGTWGNPNVDIPGWIQISVDQVRCGDVAAYRKHTTDATGHMGVMFYSNHNGGWTLIYAGSSQHPEQIVRSLFFTPTARGRQSWFNQYPWVFRRYVGE